MEIIAKDREEKRTIALMCPNCFDIVATVEVDIKTTFKELANSTPKFYHHVVNFSIDGECDGCHDYIDQYINIDAEIAPAISILNKKGWKTEYCCAGHQYERGYSSAYISFTSDALLKYNPMLLLPTGWRVDIHKYTQSHKLVMRSKQGEYNATELTEWAERLPYIVDVAKLKPMPNDEVMDHLLNLNPSLTEE